MKSRVAFFAHLGLVFVLALVSWIVGLDETGMANDAYVLWVVTFALAASLVAHLPRQRA